MTHNSAYTRAVQQTSPAPQSGTEETRIYTYLVYIARVITTQPLQAPKYLAVDGYCSKKKCVEGVHALRTCLSSAGSAVMPISGASTADHAGMALDGPKPTMGKSTSVI